MYQYLLRRAIQGVGVVFGVLTLVFVMVQLTGDPVATLVPGDMSEADIARIRASFGLDRPLHVQYASFLKSAASGDFGLSFRYLLPSMEVVLERLPATLELGFAALVIGTLAGGLLGIVAASYRNSWADNATMLFALIGQAAPNYWLGIMGILLFAVQLDWLPTTGRGTLANLVLPALTLSLAPMARIARLTRSSMLEVLGQDYVRTSRALGFSPRTVTFRYALKNSLIAPLTMLGLEVGTVLGGAVVVETVFAWPGMGRLAVQSLLARDFPVVLAVVFLVTLAYVTTNLVIDVIYARVDPRVSL